MIDDVDRLRANPALLQLLTHYAKLGEEDRTNWQDRLMVMDEIEGGQLSKLHGELIAFGWVDQNTGQVPILKPGAAPACYRITLHGLRAIQQVHGPVIEDEDILERLDQPAPRFPRKKRAKTESAELLSVAGAE